MGINHFFPTHRTVRPEPGDEAICGFIVTKETEPADTRQFQLYCVECLKAVFEVETGTLFAEPAK